MTRRVYYACSAAGGCCVAFAEPLLRGLTPLWARAHAHSYVYGTRVTVVVCAGENGIICHCRAEQRFVCVVMACASQGSALSCGHVCECGLRNTHARTHVVGVWRVMCGREFVREHLYCSRKSFMLFASYGRRLRQLRLMLEKMYSTCICIFR